jgi:hypothetical protein
MLAGLPHGVGGFCDARIIYMQDYGGVGLRKALAHPDRIEALIIQDAVAHIERFRSGA